MLQCNEIYYALTGLKPNKPRDIVKALSPALATKIESARIDTRRMKLGKIIGKGKYVNLFRSNMLVHVFLRRTLALPNESNNFVMLHRKQCCISVAPMNILLCMR